jgi:hypothetical protein
MHSLRVIALLATTVVTIPVPAGHGAQTESSLPGGAAVVQELEAEALARQERTLAQERAEATARALADLQRDLQAIRTRLEAPPTAPAAGASPTAPDSHTARALENIQTRLGSLERLLVPGGNVADTAFPFPRTATILAGLAAALALVGIVSIFWARPGARGGSASVPGSVTKQLEEIRKALASLGPQPASSTPAASAGGIDAAGLVQATNALRASAEKVAREHKDLAGLLEQFSQLGTSVQPALEALAARATEIEEARSALARERAEVEGKQAEIAAAATAGATASDRLREVEARLQLRDAVWPAPFVGDGPLPALRERVLVGIAEGRPEATAVLSALLRWHQLAAVGDKEREHWIEAVDAVGRASLAFLAKEPDPAGGAEEALERGQLWTRAFKTPLEQAFPELKLNAVYPGDRFDTDRMEATSSISGGRQTVHRALTWSILEKTAEATRIVRRAQVITA